MGDESPSRLSSAAGTPLRRSLTVDESSSLRRRGSTKRLSAQDTPTSGLRRRSSTFSDYSIREARKSFQSSTDDLLHPRPNATASESKEENSPWHSLPLAFALLPALGGMIWTNGSSVITDIMLLGLAAIFLNWSVRVPWTWYHSAQSLRKLEEYNADSMTSDESEDDNALSFSKETLEEVPEDVPAESSSPKPVRKLPAHEHATNELYFHELLALMSCFMLPACGAYLLHTIRSQLTRSSEGLVSNYNLTIFLLAAEIRPMGHLVKLVQARTLHLQRVANSNPYDTINGQSIGDVKELSRRLEDLEARNIIAETLNASSEPSLNGKQSAALTVEVRRTIQPDFDALNRAVRRYEKRATLQAFQTDSRIHELEARLNDAISLAAAAANSQKNHSFSGIILEWAASAVVLPIQALGALIILPFKTVTTLVNIGKTSVTGRKSFEKGRKTMLSGSRYPANGRQQRPIKK